MKQIKQYSTGKIIYITFGKPTGQYPKKNKTKKQTNKQTNKKQNEEKTELKIKVLQKYFLMVLPAGLS